MDGLVTGRHTVETGMARAGAPRRPRTKRDWGWSVELLVMGAGKESGTLTENMMPKEVRSDPKR